MSPDPVGHPSAPDAGPAPSPEEQAAFLETIEEIERKQITIRKQHLFGREVAWAPQDGSQVEFLQCPLFECLYHGTRGPGKTDAFLWSYAQHVGKWGASWRGIVFRKTYPELADVVAKSRKWFGQVFPSARFNQQRMEWTWPSGEVLLFRHMRVPADYWNYHGHEYPWIGFEELTNWADQDCYTQMFACCRSSDPRVPKMIRSTANPYGVGHNWVRDRFALFGEWWKTKVQIRPTDHEGNVEPPRAAIHGHISENKILLEADPDYPRKIAAAARNPAQKKAWLTGSWDVVAGGMFDDVWSHKHNLVPQFVIPEGWMVDRAFDWGSSKPFSVGWYAQSDGSDLKFPDGKWHSTVRGDVFRMCEWYGWTGRPNEGLRMLATEVAEGIIERELVWGFRQPGARKSRVTPGPADSSIFTIENGRSIALDMERPVRIGSTVYPGVTWTPADKRPGSRKAGWEHMRIMIKAAHSVPGQAREQPGFFVVVDRNPQFLRTVLSLPRDEKDLDDVDTDAEDHSGDETRYRLKSGGATAQSIRIVGMH